MSLIPRNWEELSVEELQYREGKIYGRQPDNGRRGEKCIQGQVRGELHKCSYCDSTKIRYKGTVSIGGVGCWSYLACEKCKKKGSKAYKKRPFGLHKERPETPVKQSGLGRIGNVKGSGEPLQDINA